MNETLLHVFCHLFFFIYFFTSCLSEYPISHVVHTHSSRLYLIYFYAWVFWSLSNLNRFYTHICVALENLREIILLIHIGSMRFVNQLAFTNDTHIPLNLSETFPLTTSIHLGNFWMDIFSQMKSCPIHAWYVMNLCPINRHKVQHELWPFFFFKLLSLKTTIKTL